jgi:hypothetical protein
MQHEIISFAMDKLSQERLDQTRDYEPECPAYTDVFMHMRTIHDRLMKRKVKYHQIDPLKKKIELKTIEPHSWER